MLIVCNIEYQNLALLCISKRMYRTLEYSLNEYRGWAFNMLKPQSREQRMVFKQQIFVSTQDWWVVSHVFLQNNKNRDKAK